MRQIKKIIIHCTTSSDDKNAEYHIIIHKDGSCQNNIPESNIAKHLKDHNRNSIGIAWVGPGEITLEQKKTLDSTIRRILKIYDISINDIYGHYELCTGKTCPNLDMDGLRKSIRTEEYLPDGPSDDEIEISLIDIENQVLSED